MYNKATKYLYNHKFEKALAFFKKEPLEFKEKYLNMGNCYRHLDDDANALKHYLLAAREDIPFSNGKRGQYDMAYNNLGLLCYAQGKDDEAIAFYRAALSLNPMYCDAIWNHGNALLRKYFSSDKPDAMDWKLGWEMYEYRFKRESGAVVVDGCVPRWDGVSRGSSIVVLSEQGFGDKIMFGRYIHKLYDYFDTVYVQCHESLDVFFNDFTICRSVPVDAQYSIPICSLAGHFGLISEKWLEGKFSAREFSKDRLNIGVVWSGSRTHANDRNRSCSSNYFSRLADLGRLYSITPDAMAAREVCGIGSKDWSQTASTLLGLDLVVSVDTSIVHLCGTLGVPCIMIQPLKETDFRWGLGHTDTPWYSSVVVLENPGWEKAIDNVRKIIKEHNV